jgi:nucleoside-diphosphate-sugar epimerase
VTGAAGFIGSHLVERLTAAGRDVTAIDCFSPYYDPSLKRANADHLRDAYGIEVIDVDLRTVDLQPLLEGVDDVFHFAAQPGVRPSWATFEEYVSQNVLVTHRLLEAVLGTSVRRFVFASSSSVYGHVRDSVDEDAPTRPFSPYGVTKLAAETLCGAYAQNFSVPVTSLRLFTVYGPRQRPDMAFDRLIRSALTDDPFTVFGDGSQVRSFTYVDDVVDAALAAATTDIEPGLVFNVSGDAVTTLNDVIAAVAEATGRPVHVVYEPASPGDVDRTAASIVRAGELLGWRPATSLSEGIALQVADVRRRLDAGARFSTSALR